MGQNPVGIPGTARQLADVVLTARQFADVHHTTKQLADVVRTALPAKREERS